MAAVSVKSPSKWRHHKNFHLGISMGSAHHAGAALAAIVDWANCAGFENGLIDVSDTLNRYNLMRDGLDEDTARHRASEQGKAWVASNKAILERLKMPYKVIHWDHWLSDDRFPGYEQAFAVAYEEDADFKAAILRDIRYYHFRKSGQNISDLSPRDIEFGKRFYFEELAALSIQFEDYPCAEAYPGRELESLKLIRRGQVKNAPKGIQNANFAKIFIRDLPAPEGPQLDQRRQSRDFDDQKPKVA